MKFERKSLCGAANVEREAPAPPIRVLIADDHVMVLEGLVAIISRQKDMAVVAQAANGQECVELWHEHRPDIALVDLRMPRLDGVAAIELIRRADPAARAIVLTTYDTDNDIVGAVKAGAKAFLLKDARRDDILDCIRRVHAGETCLPPAFTSILAANLSNQPLTCREQNVLEMLARGKSNKEIATELHISETTVKSHLRSIFFKLNVLSRTEAVAVASRRGLVKL
ncbi:DNA-binding response regulator [Verrucomicrobia bacterium LW23]|nr:DNA-binding response regulator [Verrucomicrobia bacterium LW23]